MDSLTSAESSLANSFILSDPTAGISQTLLEVPGAPAPTHEIRRGRTARRQKRMAEDHQTRHSRSFSGNYFDDIEICESPVRKFCDGTCREASTALWIQRDDDSAECAHVVSANCPTPLVRNLRKQTNFLLFAGGYSPSRCASLRATTTSWPGWTARATQ